MTITLTPEFEQYIAAKVESGDFGSPNEVIACGLHLLQEQDAIQEQETMNGIPLEELRREIAIGVEASERGEYTVYSSGRELMEDIVKKGLARLEARRQVTKTTTADSQGM